MRRLITICVALAVLGVPATAQKIETEKADRSRIVHVQTALNHLTVIEVGEPVTTVAAGSSAFKIEWRENKVFIQPTERDVATNLFIWTASGRLNYELEPAGAVDQMDFAIDHPAAQSAPPVIATKPSPMAAAGEVAIEALLGGRPIRMEGVKEPKNQVIVLVKDVFQRENNETFIRYAIRNDSKESYRLGTPEVFTLNVSSHPGFFGRFSNSQLTDADAGQIETDGQTPVAVVAGRARASRVEPGQETVGVVGIKLPAAKTGPTVLRLVFPRNGKAQPTATLVL
jgi:hypothetical protein